MGHRRLQDCLHLNRLKPLSACDLIFTTSALVLVAKEENKAVKPSEIEEIVYYSETTHRGTHERFSCSFSLTLKQKDRSQISAV